MHDGLVIELTVTEIQFGYPMHDGLVIELTVTEIPEIQIRGLSIQVPN